MAVVQISKIQHRRGRQIDLPTRLDEAEFGFATDTGELFIGASNLSSIRGRNTYPFENLKVLTELDMHRTITGDVYYHGPIVSAVAQPFVGRQNMFGLFREGETEFCNYDFSLKSTTSNLRIVGMVTVIVDTTNINNPTSVRVIPGSVNVIGMSLASLPFQDSFSTQEFQLRNINGIIWMTFQNNFGEPLILSMSGREWSTPAPNFAPPPPPPPPPEDDEEGPGTIS